MRRWTRAASEVAHLDAPGLKDLQRQANRLSRRLTHVLHAAEARLADPLAPPANLSLPTHTDWTWLPTLCTGPIHPVGIAQLENATRLCPDAAIFHDCPCAEITLRQSRASQTSAPFETTLDILGFQGSYLSLALDLPNDALAGLTHRHIFSLTAALTTERDLDIYARLNLRHGPNVDRVTCKLDANAGPQTVDFDLATTEVDDTRMNHVWIDLLFEAPAYNRITLQSAALTRRPRAEV